MVALHGGTLLPLRKTTFFVIVRGERDEMQDVCMGVCFWFLFLINWLNFVAFFHRQGNVFRETNACSLFLIDKIFAFNCTNAEVQCDFCSSGSVNSFILNVPS